MGGGAKDNRKVCVCWGEASYTHASPHAEKAIGQEQAYIVQRNNL